MCKIKYYLFFEKTIHSFFVGSVVFYYLFLPTCMKLNKIKKDLTPRIKNVSKKIEFNVLTNENDFLVKNLKKAG